MAMRLMRVWYDTDARYHDNPEYLGAFSVPMGNEGPNGRIVAVDWSQRGVVEVTWLVPS